MLQQSLNQTYISSRSENVYILTNTNAKHKLWITYYQHSHAKEYPMLLEIGH